MPSQLRTIELGEADIAVTGEEEPSLRSTMIARDGIAVLTNFSNPVKEMASRRNLETYFLETAILVSGL